MNIAFCYESVLPSRGGCAAYIAGLARRLVAISEMLRDHFEHHYGLAPADLRVVRIATHPERFDERDRPRRRLEWRSRWGLSPEAIVALFAGINYRLKGLEPLLHALRL